MSDQSGWQPAPMDDPAEPAAGGDPHAQVPPTPPMPPTLPGSAAEPPLPFAANWTAPTGVAPVQAQGPSPVDPFPPYPFGSLPPGPPPAPTAGVPVRRPTRSVVILAVLLVLALGAVGGLAAVVASDEDEPAEAADADEDAQQEIDDLRDQLDEMEQFGEMMEEDFFTSYEPESTESSQSSPVPLGEPALISGVEFTVIGVSFDDTARVLAASPEFAQPPASGRVYATVQLTVKLVDEEWGYGAGPGDFLYELLSNGGDYDFIVGPQAPDSPANTGSLDELPADVESLTVRATFEIDPADGPGTVLEVRPSDYGWVYGDPVYLALS